MEPDLYTDSSVLSGSIKEQMEIMGGKQIIEIAEAAARSWACRSPISDFSREKINASVNELKQEKSLVSELLR